MINIISIVLFCSSHNRLKIVYINTTWLQKPSIQLCFLVQDAYNLILFNLYI